MRWRCWHALRSWHPAAESSLLGLAGVVVGGGRGDWGGHRGGHSGDG